VTKNPNRPRDPNQLAKAIADIATGELADSPKSSAVSDMAALGRSGGIKGGASRAQKLSPERRAEIASHAAAARWKREREGS